MSLTNKGKPISTAHKAKIRKKLFVYSNTTPTILYPEFTSCAEAAKHFSCSIATISRYVKGRKLFKNKCILCTSSITEKRGGGK